MDAAHHTYQARRKWLVVAEAVSIDAFPTAAELERGEKAQHIRDICIPFFACVSHSLVLCYR
eukprot:43971-Eustigmatos_ZCMA.PRE.1